MNKKNMKTKVLTAAFIFLAFTLNAQKFMTKNGYIGFFSHTPLEDVKADNNQVASILDASTGEIVFQVLMKSFKFEKALMEEHFNENYVESDKFPKSTFKGKIGNLSDVSFTKTGTYKITVNGELFMHGVTQNISAPGEIEITGDGINGHSQFIIKPEDYKVEIPAVVRENIAKEITVTVDVKMTPVGN
jgi:polyisoprenoid-binding protein YceI